MEVEDPQVIVKAISDLGQPLYGRPTSDGYAMLSTPWVNSAALLARMNFSLALAGNRLSKGVTVDWLAQLGMTSLQKPEEQERQLEDLILHGQVSSQTQDLVLQQLAGKPAQASLQPIAQQDPAAARKAADRQAALAAGLLFGSPDFQRR